jgi:hypothetical protein
MQHGGTFAYNCVAMEELYMTVSVSSSSSSSSSSSVPFTPCGAQGIHEELSSVAVSSYSLDLIP